MSSDHVTEGRTARLERETTATPAQVWAVLAEGWSYAAWVVGASRVRSVDPTWPAPGALIHHSAGAWPLLLDDQTEVVESEPERRLVLQARGRPLGEATVALELTPTATGTVVSMLEDVSHGPTLALPKAVRQLLIAPRNTETLHRLVLLAERRTA